jgi:hypothetical protein
VRFRWRPRRRNDILQKKTLNILIVYNWGPRIWNQNRLLPRREGGRPCSSSSSRRTSSVARRRSWSAALPPTSLSIYRRPPSRGFVGLPLASETSSASPVPRWSPSFLIVHSHQPPARLDLLQPPARPPSSLPLELLTVSCPWTRALTPQTSTPLRRRPRAGLPAGLPSSRSSSCRPRPRACVLTSSS